MKRKNAMNLPLPVPQILPLDLKLFGSDSKQDESPGNQGDSPQPGAYTAGEDK